MGTEIIPLIFAMSIVGSTLGAFTGLVPGIHVNTLAAIMLASYTSLFAAISGFAESEAVPILISSCILSASIVHSFMDFIPSVFIGAPDADEALTMLPGHRLLMEGKGMVAVRAAAAGSVVGAVSAVALSIPIQYVMLRGAAELMDGLTVYVVIFVATVIIFSADGLKGKSFALVLFFISGFMGVLCGTDGLRCDGLFENGTLLFPLLSGLFGIPPLLKTASGGELPEQSDYDMDPVGPVPGLKGVVTGSIAGWFPGITATAGAALSASIKKEKRPEAFISMVASIGTVTSVLSLVTLSITGSGRSGTSAVIKEIIGDGLKGFCSESFILLLLTICIAAVIGYVLTILSGRVMSGIADKVNPRTMSACALIAVTALVILITGIGGFVILAVATLIGLTPQQTGVSRIPLTGCLLLPVIIGGLF